MNPIIPPLKAGDRGEPVGNLQEALLLLLGRAVIPASEDERRSLTVLLQRERKPAPERRAMGILRPRESQQPVYGDGTTKAVALFQQGHHLRPNGQVDEPIVNAINTALRELGALPAAAQATRPAQPETIRPAEDGKPVRLLVDRMNRLPQDNGRRTLTARRGRAVGSRMSCSLPSRARLSAASALASAGSRSRSWTRMSATTVAACTSPRPSPTTAAHSRSAFTPPPCQSGDNRIIATWTFLSRKIDSGHVAPRLH